jgi:hypothetical protein
MFAPTDGYVELGVGGRGILLVGEEAALAPVQRTQTLIQTHQLVRAETVIVKGH